MSAALIAIFETLGANWFAAVIIFLVLTLVWYVIGIFVDRVVRPSKASLIISASVQAVIWFYVFNTLGYTNVAGGLIGLTGYSLMQQLMALKIQNEFKQQATDAGLAPDAA